MKFLAVSGSARAGSTNTALLRAIGELAPRGIVVSVFDRLGDLPVFSPDLEGDRTPAPVVDFKRAIGESDGLILSSPEYVRTIPGGLKNAIDWLVSGDEIAGKPAVLAHASHRGDDMLSELRTVLGTVTPNFSEEIFLRFDLMKETPQRIRSIVTAPEGRRRVEAFLGRFAEFCRLCRSAAEEASGP